ncbi:MAG: hypothetical protein P1P63_06980 [Treponemataceae bacterium]
MKNTLTFALHLGALKKKLDKKGGEEYLRRHLNNPSFVMDTLLRIEKDSL